VRKAATFLVASQQLCCY